MSDMVKVQLNQANGIEPGDMVYSSKDGEVYRVTKVGTHWSVPGSSGYYCDLEHYDNVSYLSDEEFEDIVLTLHE